MKTINVAKNRNVELYNCIKLLSSYVNTVKELLNLATFQLLKDCARAKGSSVKNFVRENTLLVLLAEKIRC